MFIPLIRALPPSVFIVLKIILYTINEKLFHKSTEKTSARALLTFYCTFTNTIHFTILFKMAFLTNNWIALANYFWKTLFTLFQVGGYKVTGYKSLTNYQSLKSEGNEI